MRHTTTHAAAVTLPALVCTALLLGGCGSGRVQAANLSATARPDGFLTIRYRADGVALQVPGNWTATAETSPMVAVFSSGAATIALWRFTRVGGAITSIPRLHSALSRLVAAVRAKDPGMTLQRTGVSSVSGAGAVIIDALEQVGGQRRRVRSEHIYADGAELVLDAYAPPAQFADVDHLVFSPVRKSLMLLDGGRAVAGAAASTSTTVTPSVTTPVTR